MPLASTMRERVTIEHQVIGTDPEVTRTWVTLDEVWAAAEPQGDGRVRLRIRYDPMFPTTRGETEPAMRALYRGAYYDVQDVIESERRTELVLFIRQRIIEEIDDLRTGTHGIAAWPPA
jgi:head-tail adaptor